MFIKRISRAMHNIFDDRREWINEFGTCFWIKDVVINRIHAIDKETHYRNVYRCLYKELSPLIMEYKKKSYETQDRNANLLENTVPVWVCWWQGESNMPELVKTCYISMKRMLPDICNIQLITFENVNQYISLPQNIVDLYNKGVISKTYLSDVLRLMLICEYGGFWIDATYYFAKPVSKDAVLHPFFMRRRNSERVKESVSAGRWSFNYFIGQKGDPFYCFLRDALILYWGKHKKLIDGLLADFIIWIAYDSLPGVRERFLKLPYTDSESTALNEFINEEYDEETWNNLIRDCKVFKLTYKKELMKYTDAGKLTYWGYISEGTI